MEDITQTLIDITNNVWDATIRRDAAFYRNFLIEEAVRINGSGVADKPALIKQLEQPAAVSVTKVAMKNAKAIRLTADSALLTYEATINVTRNGAEIVLSDYITTVFVKRDGEWKGALQQHTPTA